VNRRPAPAKLNLALVVGPRGAEGRHEVATVLQRLDLADRISLERAQQLSVAGFPDTLVARALSSLAVAAGVEPGWAVSIEKAVPVAAGLGGGSSDAATALRLANETLAQPLGREPLRELAAAVGADVPFFLEAGPQLATGDGSRLASLDLPQDYWVLLVLLHRERKASTATVYQDFDARGGARGYEERRAALLEALPRVRRARDLAQLPGNDLAGSPVESRLRELGAFRAGVSGAGPAVYGLFHHRGTVVEAERRLAPSARTWVTVPAWYF
jgi:4-diphosphocytidyl-2-C-methyl-D-erythritol kinase